MNVRATGEHIRCLGLSHTANGTRTSNTMTALPGEFPALVEHCEFREKPTPSIVMESPELFRPSRRPFVEHGLNSGRVEIGRDFIVLIGLQIRDS